MRNKKVLWIAQTAIFIALIVVVQFITRGFGQFVTGACVNLILIAAGLTVGLYAGVTVAVVSPVFAFLLGIGPALLPLVPLIIIGNLVIVFVTYTIISKTHSLEKVNYLWWSAAVVSGAVAKFLVLWLGVVKIALPLIPNLKEKQIQTLSAMFSWPQLVTALIGGFLAVLILPLIYRALNHKKQAS